MLNIALLQISAFGFDQQANFEKGADFCRIAKKIGADIALFPEMWNIGYTPYSKSVLRRNFNPRNSKEQKAARKWQQMAISKNSKFVVGYKRLAKELKMAIAVTFLEKSSGAPYNSIIVIDRHGKIVLSYSKVHTCDFSLEAFCSAGKEFKVCNLDTAKGKVNVGSMICFDREFPESARILMKKGAEVILVPNACELEQNRIAQIRTRAYENMLGIAVTNYPKTQQNGNSVAFDGRAFDSKGSRDHLLIKAPQREGVYLAQFDLKAMRKYREEEVWGDTMRKPELYHSLCECKK